MKTKAILTLIACLVTAACSAHAGPIGSGGFIIDRPGKYYLIRNLAGRAPAGFSQRFGILIKADDVELDLGGFTIAQQAGSIGTGIGIEVIPDVKNVRVRNGRIRGFDIGILTSVGQIGTDDCLFELLQVADCGSAGIVFGGDRNLLRHCVVSGVVTQAHGILAVLNPGTSNEVVDCTVFGEGAGTGISASSAGTLIIRRCSAHRLDQGFSTVSGCKLFENMTIGCVQGFSGAGLLIGTNN